MFLFCVAKLAVGLAGTAVAVDVGAVALHYSERVSSVPQLRGAMSPGGLRCTEQDVADLAAAGATVIRYQLNGMGDYLRLTGRGEEYDRGDVPAKLAIWDEWLEKGLERFDQAICWARKYRMRLILDLHVPPGDRGLAYSRELSMFFDRRLADHFVEVWRMMASRYRGNCDVIFGYDLVNEPLQIHATEPGCANLELQKRAAEAIRAVDPETTIIVECGEFGNPEGFKDLVPIGLPDVIYSCHMYRPHQYTHQKAPTNEASVATLVAYPSPEKRFGRSRHPLTKEGLRAYLQPVREFQQKYGARILIGEFSAPNYAPGADRYMADCIDIFDELGWDWVFHSWRENRYWNVAKTFDFKTFNLNSSTNNARYRVLMNGFRKSGPVAVGDVKVGFAVHLARPGNEGIFVTDSDMVSVAVTRGARRVVAVWKGHPICGSDFRVIAEFDRTDDGWRWGFRYEDNVVTNLDVESITFPIVEAPRSDKTGVIRPKSLGLLEHPDWRSLKPGQRIASDVPMPFRFVAACDGSANGLYLDERGARGSAGSLVSENGVAPQTVRLIAKHDMAVSPEHNKSFILPYGGVIGRFAGNWYDAVKIYREWVSREPWVRISRNKDRSQLRDIALWLWQRGESERVVAPAERFLRETGLKPAVDWYWWHKIPYDTQYPFFWPPREGEEVFRAAVSRMRSKGIFSQVYINGMSWDCDDPSWESGGGFEAVRYPDRDGPFWSRMYNVFTQHRLAHLCGEATKFHDHLAGLAKTLSDCGLDGLYLDQIGYSSLGSCWNPSHKHAPGGGTAVTDGYRNLFRKIRSKCPALLLSTEEPNEEYLPETDTAICLWQNSERFLQRGWQDCEPIPVFQALHHRDKTLFGSFAIIGGQTAWDPTWPSANRWTDEDRWKSIYPRDQFALEFVRGVVFGNQPCVHNLTLEQILDEEHVDDWRLVKDTAAFYHANRDVLFDGEMSDPGVVTCELVTLDFAIRGTYTTEQTLKRVQTTCPAVLHSVWRTKAGETAAILVNWTHQAQDYKFTSRDYAFSGNLPARKWMRMDFPAVNSKNRKPSKGEMFTGSGARITSEIACFEVVNPLVRQNAPDPFTTYDAKSGWYYHLHTDNPIDGSGGFSADKVVLHRARRAGDLLKADESSVVYRANADDGVFGFLWAPEMHRAPDGKWYIYTSCTRDPASDVKRLLVLEAKTDDPFDGFLFKDCPDERIFAIDPTVFTTKDGQQYMCYSQVKPKKGQVLQIREMTSPWAFGPRQTELAFAELPWECVPPYDKSKILEGAFFVKGTKNGRAYIVYSANGCWSRGYCLGVLEHQGGDLCDAENWKKWPKPVFASGNGVYGPGHAAFFRSPDEKELWVSYHFLADENRTNRPTDRLFALQKFNVDAKTGAPAVTIPVRLGESRPAPSGEGCGEIDFTE